MIIGIIIGILLTNTLFLAEIWLKSDSGILKIFHNKTKDFLPQPKGFIVKTPTTKELGIKKMEEEAGIEGIPYNNLIE